MKIDEKIKQYATPQQCEYIDAVNKEGSLQKAATALGVNLRTVTRSVSNAKARAAKHGHSPEHDMVHTSPDTHVVKGVSTLYNEDGQVKAQWVKTQLDREEELKQVESAIQQYVEDLTGKAPKIPKPKAAKENLLASYNVGDAHIGMYAWGEEAGTDFDADIAAKELKAVCENLVSMAPPAETALIINFGDFFHFDDDSKTTRRSGHSLDGDSRLERVFRIGLAVMNHLVSLALQKHNKVVVRNVRGNHDDITAVGLKYAMWAYWKGEKRVTVDLSSDTFWYYEFGSTLIMATHGHQCKPINMGGVMACDQREAWGRTKHHYAWHGHFHSKSCLDLPGCRVEGFTNLAPNDAHHHGQGYRSPQEMTLVIIDKERGDIGRLIERIAA